MTIIGNEVEDLHKLLLEYMLDDPTVKIVLKEADTYAISEIRVARGVLTVIVRDTVRVSVRLKNKIIQSLKKSASMGFDDRADLAALLYLWMKMCECKEYRIPIITNDSLINLVAPDSETNRCKFYMVDEHDCYSDPILESIPVQSASKGPHNLPIQYTSKTSDIDMSIAYELTTIQILGNKMNPIALKEAIRSIPYIDHRIKTVNDYNSIYGASALYYSELNMLISTLEHSLVCSNMKALNKSDMV